MSDILIKGMGMPKDIEPGLVIEFADGIDGKRYARLYHYQHGGLTEWCEAVPVPPHGDLIDRDVLIGSDGDLWDGMWGWSGVQIANAPTIIPAEEERKNNK